jgi:hypothetical protein
MVTVRLPARLVLLAAGGALALTACGNAVQQPGDQQGTQPATASSSTVAPSPGTPSASATPKPGDPLPIPNPSGGVHPGPTGIPIGTGKPVSVDGIIEEGVEPGCKVLTAGSTMYLILGGKDVPTGVPVRVEGVLQPGVLSTCQQGTPLRVTSVTRR